MLLLATCVIGSLLALFLYSFKPDPKPIFGIYHRRGKWFWLKYYAFLALYHYRKLSSKNRSAPELKEAGRGVKAIADPVEMDRALALSNDPHAFDAVFFIAATEGANGQGIYFEAGCERRHRGICVGVFYLALPGKGLLCCKKFPDTLMFGAKEEQFGAEGLLIEPKEPMKRWTVSYKGQAWIEGEDPTKLLDVDFKGEWVADSPRYFDYDTDIHPPAVARAIALQPWSRKYFEDLKQAHQSHYEQFGTMTAKYTIDGEPGEIQMRCFRDHSFGHKRDWGLMHRYILHNIFLEDRMCISVGVVCQPATSPSFEMGVVALPNGELVPTDWIDLELYQYGDKGNPPQEYAFQFEAAGKIYTVEVFVEHQSVHYKGFNWEGRMVERFCRYVVNGIPGRGSNPLMYSHHGGRPEHISREDPEWYRMNMGVQYSDKWEDCKIH